MSTVITITPVAITANVQKNSASHTLTAQTKNVLVQMTDSAGNSTPLAGSNWLTTTGNILQWGMQISKDGGATWNWGPIWQGDGINPAVRFGALTKGGTLPTLQVDSTLLQGDVNDQVRLAILVDTNITLGAVVTVN